MVAFEVGGASICLGPDVVSGCDQSARRSYLLDYILLFICIATSSDVLLVRFPISNCFIALYSIFREPRPMNKDSRVAKETTLSKSVDGLVIALDFDHFVPSGDFLFGRRGIVMGALLSSYISVLALYASHCSIVVMRML